MTTFKRSWFIHILCWTIIGAVVLTASSPFVQETAAQSGSTYTVYMPIVPHAGALPPITPKTGTSELGVVLYNADTNEPIPGYNPLPEEVELDLDTLPGSSWNFVADVSATNGNVESVAFSGSYETVQNDPPYALFGDAGDDILGQWLDLGSHTLTVQAYDGADGTGRLLAEETISFDVVSSNEVPPSSGDCDQTVNDFDQIQWNNNAVICLEQGTYQDTLYIEADGVTIRGLGKVTLFGGRDRPLPYCGQSNYDPSDALDWGIRTRGYSDLIIENLTIHGYATEGIHIDSGTNNSLFRDLVIYDNGSGVRKSDGYWPAGEGVRLNGHGITFDHVRIFNNGEDQIQNYSNVSISNLTIRNSWLYNDRKHPNRDDSFNHCAHSDGIQIFDGERVDDVLIENTYFSGLTQCIIFGETKSGLATTVNDVVLRDVVCDQASGIGIYSKNSNSTNWTLDRVTLYCGDGYTGNCLHINGDNTTVKDSIIDGSKIVAPQGFTGQTAGNCQDNIPKWHDEHADIGPDVNLNYTNAGAPLSSTNDFTLVNGGNCTGSRLTSVAQLGFK